MYWTTEQLAYFAGIIDGEGCFCLHDNGSHRFSSQLQLGNTNPQLMEWVRSTFGGSVNAENRKNPRHKPVFRWLASTENIDAMVQAILPYLIVKKAQAELFLAYRRTLAPKVNTKRSTNDTTVAIKSERFRIHRELRALNKRGIA